MRLVEVKIIYKANSIIVEDVYSLLIEPMLQFSDDVIHVSKTIIEGGDDEG